MNVKNLKLKCKLTFFLLISIFLCSQWNTGDAAVLVTKSNRSLANFPVIQKPSVLDIFVSRSGDDANNGSIASPLRTIEAAQVYIRKEKKEGNYTKIIVNIRSGTYFLSKPLIFAPDDGGSANCLVEYRGYDKEIPVISGGLPLPKQWVKLNSVGINFWKLKLDNEINTSKLNQLFINNQRLHRCSSPLFFVAGPLQKYAGLINNTTPNKYTVLPGIKQKDLLPFCSFDYNGNDLDSLGDDVDNAELLLYHSWDCTWHKIYQVNSQEHSVYLRSPASYPVTFFPGIEHYFIENCKKYLKNPGDWYFDNINKELWYVSKNNEDPNSESFIIPQIAQLLILKGDRTFKKPLQNLIFNGIYFEHTLAPRGINVDKKAIDRSLGVMPWLDLNSGFSGFPNSAEVGSSISLQYTKNIDFDSCRFSALGNYALQIDKYSNTNRISTCEFYDLGGGGIIIGYSHSNPASVGIFLEASPVKNTVEECKIHDIGIVFPSGVGIAILNADSSNISNNELYNMPYSGIVSGISYGFGTSYTFGNIIQNNKVHDVLKDLADGGGIYTLGVQPNTIIRGNIIHDITRSKNAIGANNNGIFFDEGSSQMTVKNNTIYNIQNEPIRFNKTDATKLKLVDNKLK